MLSAVGQLLTKRKTVSMAVINAPQSTALGPSQFIIYTTDLLFSVENQRAVYAGGFTSLGTLKILPRRTAVKVSLRRNFLRIIEPNNITRLCWSSSKCRHSLKVGYL